MSARTDDTDDTKRLDVVRAVIDELWPPQDDGCWSDLEGALVIILKKSRRAKPRLLAPTPRVRRGRHEAWLRSQLDGLGQGGA